MMTLKLQYFSGKNYITCHFLRGKTPFNLKGGKQKKMFGQCDDMLLLLEYVLTNNFEHLSRYVDSDPNSRYIRSTNFSINNDRMCNSHRQFLPMKSLSLMHVAALCDSLECFCILHQKSRLSVSIENASSLHPIQYACFSDSLEIVTYICHVNPYEAIHQFPPEYSLFLCFSMRCGNSDKIIRFLQSKGTEYPKYAEYSPLKASIMKNNIPQLIALLFILKACDPKSSLIMTAIKQQEFDAVPILVEAGEDPSYVNEDGRSAIDLACFTNRRVNGIDSNYNILKIMLEKVNSIEPKMTNVNGPEHWICRAQSPEIAKLFFNQPHLTIDVMRINEKGITGPSLLLTPITYNSQCDVFTNSLKILKLFLENGFNVNYMNRETHTPTLLEAYLSNIKPSPEMIEWLLNYGANPYLECVNRKGTIFENGMNVFCLKSIFEKYSKLHPPPTVIS
ncbi:hypothetical protein TRFO_22604 [Tritrichomonas foetus]|uniref:Uncharacterized protein n=1 Tax=Tritrichomonas foetus TaxID=1144522 RepID=A0A1J4KCV9_9EUKA|nr:hypothetical protein TRFO_22604 [Tritrichomonas foetus]|eukprot:OHT08776.1 hypothetical protein TRFO_22604 [Tritrichomonas foetus]